MPPDFHLVAFQIDDPDEPDLVAESAALIVLRRDNGRLQAGRSGKRLRIRERSNALWILHAPLVRAADNKLVLGALTVAPAFEGQLSRAGDDTAHGVTSELLRLLSPAQLLNEAAEYLARQHHHTQRLQGARAAIGGEHARAGSQRDRVAAREGGVLEQVVRVWGSINSVPVGEPMTLQAKPSLRTPQVFGDALGA